MFGDLKKQAEETRKQWTEIEEKAEKLKSILDQGKSDNYDRVRATAELVLLLVEQFKPMSKIDGEGFMKEILEAFTGGKTDGE